MKTCTECVFGGKYMYIYNYINNNGELLCIHVMFGGKKRKKKELKVI